jgi:uncharacterized OsmC-like protein
LRIAASSVSLSHRSWRSGDHPHRKTQATQSCSTEGRGPSTLPLNIAECHREPVSSAPTSYEIEARVVRPGVSAATSKQAVIEFDTSAGQSEILPGPADLLTAAFAACVLKNVERFSQILPFRYQEASIKVVAERQEAPPKMIRVTYSLQLVTDELEQRVELLQRNIQKYGTIYNTLAATCDVSGKVLVQRPDQIVAR